jgi:hypothetical protein
MRSRAFLAATASLVAMANAVTIPINMTDLVFVPEVITANQGDILEFHWLPHNHSVVMGDFDNPCMPTKTGGFYSGFFFFFFSFFLFFPLVFPHPHALNPGFLDQTWLGILVHFSPFKGHSRIMLRDVYH